MYNGTNGNGHHKPAEPLDLGLFMQEAETESFDLRDLLFRLWTRKWIITAVAVLGGLAAFGLSHVITPEFKSTGTMLVMESKTSVSSSTDLNSLLTSSYGLGMGSTMQNELYYLQSRTFSQKVAQEIHRRKFERSGRIYPILWKDFEKDSTLVGVDTVAARIRTNAVYTKGVTGSSVLLVEYLSYSREEAKLVVDLIMDMYAEESTNQTRISARSALDFLNREREHITKALKKSEDELKNFMNREGVVELNEQTRLTIQELANLAANKQSNEVKLVSLRASFDYYKKQLEDLKPGLGAITADVVNSLLVRYQYKIAELESERLMIQSRNSNVADLSKEPTMQRIENELAVLKAEVRSIMEKLTGTNEQFAGFISTNDGNMSQVLISYRQKITDLQIEIQQMELQNAAITKLIKVKEDFFESLPANMTEMARKRRELIQNEQLFLAIDRQVAETALWEQTQYGLGRVIDYGDMPLKAFFPKKMVFLLGGFIFGLFGSVLYIIISAKISSRINSVDRLSKFKYPILSIISDFTETTANVKKELASSGEIPQFSEELIMVWDNISPASESFRKLANNLIYAHPDLKRQVVLTTSSNKSEGKSTVLSNLGVALAESNKKTILVDMDFRRPRVASLFKDRTGKGLVSFLFDGKPLEAMIHESVLPNLDVLVIEKTIQNPVSVINSQKMKDLISQLSADYDFVLLDCPPYGIIEDAAPLFGLVSGVIVTVKFNQSTEFELKNLLNQLEKMHAPIMGLALNGFDPKQSLGYHGYTYYKRTYTDYRSYTS